MAPGFRYTHPPKLFKPYETLRFRYDPARDGYWSTGTYTDYPEPPRLTSKVLERYERMIDEAAQKQQRDMLKAMQNMWHLYPQVIDHKKVWHKMFEGNWDSDPAGPPPDGLKIWSPPEEGPLDHERDAERARKIHDLFWARKQKDPEFKLI